MMENLFVLIGNNLLAVGSGCIAYVRVSNLKINV